MDRYSRARFLLGDAAMEKLKNAHVAVFGLGGVGGYVVEALARTGVTLDVIIDAIALHTDHFRKRIAGQVLALEGKYRFQTAKIRRQCAVSGFKIPTRHYNASP